MSAKAGEAIRSGCTAEQTSWRNPGTVSSAVRHPPPGFVGSLEDVDGHAGTGQRQGRDEPIGPGTHYDGVRSPHSDVTASAPCLPRAPMTGIGLSVNRHSVRSTSASSRSGRWWKSATFRAPARVAEPDRVLGRGVPEGPLGLRPPRSGGGSRGSAGPRRVPARVPPRGTRPCPRGPRRAQSGSGPGCRQPTERPSLTRKPDRAPALVGHLQGEDAESLGLERASRDEAEAPVAAQLVRPDREERRRHHPGQQGLGVGVLVLPGQQQASPRASSRSPAVKKGSPCTWSQCRCVRRMVP